MYITMNEVKEFIKQLHKHTFLPTRPYEKKFIFKPYEKIMYEPYEKIV